MILRGIYSENEFAFPVVKQPAGNPGYVSTIEDVVTEFSMAKKYGVTGIVAHNYLQVEISFHLKSARLSKLFMAMAKF